MTKGATSTNAKSANMTPNRAPVAPASASIVKFHLYNKPRTIAASTSGPANHRQLNST